MNDDRRSNNTERHRRQFLGVQKWQPVFDRIRQVIDRADAAHAEPGDQTAFARLAFRCRAAQS